MNKNRWILPEENSTGLTQEIANDLGIDLLIAKILVNRGVNSVKAARHFMSVSSLADIGIWDGNDDIEKAVRLILMAIANNERIAVYGDFDADGVTSTCIMMTTLISLGANVIPYIPSRVDEGYGVNNAALDYLASIGVKLVVTVDCGIRSIEEALYAKSIGLHFIITDHHNLGDDLPLADSVINPKDTRYRYDEPMLAGAGVALRFSEYLYSRAMKHRNQLKRIKYDWGEILQRLSQFCAIGTVADLVPLNHIYNRAIVKAGLNAYYDNPAIGMKALAEASRLSSPRINSTNIGFDLAPRINASGRLENAMRAYDMLMNMDYADALTQAKFLDELNVRRQTLTKESYAEALNILGAEIDENPNLIFAASENFMPGIVGLVAGKLCNTYTRPALIIETHGDESHGSARSIKGIDITALLSQCSDLLIGYGGHSQAAGFTLKTSLIPELKQRLIDIISSQIDVSEMVSTIEVDATLDINSINDELWTNLKSLEPSGKDFAQPIFVSHGVIISKKNVMGSDGSHLKLHLARHKDVLQAVAFGWGDKMDRINGPISIAYQINRNSWQGSDNLQLQIMDFQI